MSDKPINVKVKSSLDIGDFILWPLILMFFLNSCSTACEKSDNIVQCAGIFYEGISQQFSIGRIKASIPEGQ